VVAHLGILLRLWLSSDGMRPLLLLNVIVALAVLVSASFRLRYIWAAKDWPYAGLMVFELLVLAGAFWAFRHHRAAELASYVAFGLHGCISVAAVIFAFGFRITRLI